MVDKSSCEEQGAEPIRSVVSGSGVATTWVAEKAPSRSLGGRKGAVAIADSAVVGLIISKPVDVEVIDQSAEGWRVAYLVMTRQMTDGLMRI